MIQVRRGSQEHEDRFALWTLGAALGIASTLMCAAASWYGMSQALSQERLLIARVGRKPMDPTFDFGLASNVWPVAVLVVAGLVLFAWSAWIGRSVGSVASLVLAAVASATLAWQIWSAARQINSCDYHESVRRFVRPGFEQLQCMR